MVKSHILIFLLLVVTLISCKKNVDKEIIKTTVTFKTGYEIRSLFTGVFKDKTTNQELVYFAEPVTKKKIKFFDLDGHIKDSIDLKAIATDISDVLSISVFSKDTILFCTYDKIVAVNSKGNIYKRVQLPVKRGNNDTNLFAGSILPNFTHNTEEIILSVDWKYNTLEGQKYASDYYSNFYYKPMYVTMRGFFKDSITYTYSEGATLYKNIADEAKLFFEVPSYRQYENTFYGFSKYSDKIFKFNSLDYSLINSYKITSEFTKIGADALELIPENWRDFNQKINKLTQTSGGIRDIYFNKSREEFYITVHHAIVYNSIGDITLRPFSILKLDKNFNTLKEIPFTDGIYNGYSTQLTPKGIMILNKKESTDEILQYDFFNF